MYNVGTKLVIKTLDELVANKELIKTEFDGVYKNDDTRMFILDTFPFFGSEVVIESIDENDHDIPYFVSEGIWLPDFMLKEIAKVPDVKAKKEDQPVDIQLDPKYDPETIYVNKFTNNPFGPLFLKLIKLDVKIAEFSNTAFSKLKRIELDYITKLLINRGFLDVDLKSITKDDLYKVVFNTVKNLNV